MRLEHDLKFYEEGSLVAVSKTCHKCRQPVSKDYYKCRCDDEYYIHKECTDLKDLSQEYHHLHPQHPLASIENNDFPYFKSVVCSFCRETCKCDEISAQCNADQGDFTLHKSCARDFLDKPELLDKFEIDQHFLHHHENHRLSPFKVRGSLYRSEDEALKINTWLFNETPWKLCAGCRCGILPGEAAFKCTGCLFFLHVECPQVPEEVVNHNSHPQHAIVLVCRQNQNTSAASESDDQEEEEEEGESNSKLQQQQCMSKVDGG